MQLICSLRPISTHISFEQCALACISYVFADVGTGANRNQYLPPDKGYDYEKPNVPFNQQPTRPQPNQVRRRHRLARERR